MKRVIIESPYAGDVARNLTYVRACLRDCIMRGEAPFASHALYTQQGVLDDTRPNERATGIAAGFAWREAADMTVFYLDLGMTKGMQQGLNDCRVRQLPHEVRALGGEWSDSEAS